MDFFIIENGQQVGPLTIAQLAEKNITSDTLVWSEGMADWQPAWKVQELRYILEEKTADANKTQQQNTTTVPPTPPVPPVSPTCKKPKSKWIWKLAGIIIVLILITFLVTNPSKESHKEALRTEVTHAIDKVSSGSSDDMFTQGLGMIARMVAGNIMDTALDQLFEYHNYLIFSKGTITIDGTEHTVSYGVFGKVITMNADDMVRALEKEDIQKETSSEANASETTDDDFSSNLQKKIEDKANKTVDQVKDKVKKKVEDKINEKLDEVAQDTSSIDKIIDKILNLF